MNPPLRRCEPKAKQSESSLRAEGEAILRVHRRRRVDGATDAGSRPGGRLTFLSRDKKVSKETRPTAPACGFPRSRPPALPAAKLATLRQRGRTAQVRRPSARRGRGEPKSNSPLRFLFRCPDPNREVPDTTLSGNRGLLKADAQETFDMSGTWKRTQPTVKYPVDGGVRGHRQIRTLL